MASIHSLSMTLVALMMLLLILPAHAMRGFDQRRDLTNVPPVSASDWTVPLDGSHTCGPDGECRWLTSMRQHDETNYYRLELT